MQYVRCMYDVCMYMQYTLFMCSYIHQTCLYLRFVPPILDRSLQRATSLRGGRVVGVIQYSSVTRGTPGVQRADLSNVTFVRHNKSVHASCTHMVCRPIAGRAQLEHPIRARHGTTRAPSAIMSKIIWAITPGGPKIYGIYIGYI